MQRGYNEESRSPFLPLEKSDCRSRRQKGSLLYRFSVIWLLLSPLNSSELPSFLGSVHTKAFPVTSFQRTPQPSGSIRRLAKAPTADNRLRWQKAQRLFGAVRHKTQHRRKTADLERFRNVTVKGVSFVKPEQISFASTHPRAYHGRLHEETTARYQVRKAVDKEMASMPVTAVGVLRRT